MSCTSCKKRDTLKERMESEMSNTPKGVIWFIIIWSGLALYGLYSLIKLIV